MASSKFISFTLLASVLCLISITSLGQLTPDFYSSSCPGVFEAVGSVVQSAVSREKRMGASLLRLHFHDCFVNGCDGSVLLDDTPSFTGEKTAGPNANSARGFNVIDDAKSQVEEVCPGVVSCADVLAITALESVVALGGPGWEIKLGRRDSRTASLSEANSGVIPSPSSTINNLINRFQAQGLSVRDLVALSGAHTIGQARCTTFRARVHNDTNIDISFARSRQLNCPLPTGLGDNNLAPLDVQSPACFDNSYFTNLINEKGLLESDQQLYSGGATDFFVEQYSQNPERFHEDFAAAMIKMGDISPLTGSNGEIRENCRVINS